MAIATKIWINAHPLLCFTALTFAITLVAWSLLLSLYGRAPIDELIGQPSALLLIYLGASGPRIAAIVLTAYTDGRAGLRKLRDRFLTLRFSLLVWLAALFLPLLLTALSVLLANPYSDALGEPVLPNAYLLVLLAAIPVFFAGPLCEELGWRGYLQPKLLALYSPLLTAIVIGTIWCFWHIPLSFTPGTTPELNTATAWLMYWADTILVSIIMLAIVIWAKGSVVAAMLFHWMSNVAFSQVIRPMYPDATEQA
ncbi:MAG: type II CAAX endopeptidase family protein [Pseudohongiella sp.]|nr:type II CAAX endopeptidase family protein [Pseudohongiella sp.]